MIGIKRSGDAPLTRPPSGRSSGRSAFPEGPPFQVDTTDVDPEIAAVYGPQLVVPISNARYALNAANARWGSLYDALYGSDAIPRDGASGDGYDPERGRQVIAWTRRFLDDVVPLASGSHAAVRVYSVKDGTLAAALDHGTTVKLARPAQFCGYRGAADKPERVLLINNGLHIEIVIDHGHPVGRTDDAGARIEIRTDVREAFQSCGYHWLHRR
jgi:malate synthase